MERKTLEANREARDYAVLVGLRSPVLGLVDAFIPAAVFRVKTAA